MIETRGVFKSSGLVSPPDPASALSRLPRLDGGTDQDGKPFLVPIALIKDSPYQTSPLNEEKVLELVENLGKNPLSSPVGLRRNALGELELIVGRHRVEAYRRLGRTDIEATLRELSDDDAEKLVFYDNLFAPSMTDFQKYLGFSQRRSRLGLTQEQLSDESGVARTTVVKLLAFDGLPETVAAALKENPGAIGANMAAEFVTLSQKDPDLAIQAVYAVALGDMTQKAAMAWLRAGGKQEEPAKVEQLKAPIKAGKQKYADVTKRASKIVIDLKADDGRLYNDLQTWLKSRAKQYFNPAHSEGERAAD